MCMFQYTIWWTTRARLLLVRLCDVRASISDTLPTRGAATSITYQLLRGATTSQLRHTMTRLFVYYYYLDTKELQASTTTSQLPTTTTRGDQSTTSLLLRLTTCRVHKLLLCGVPPVHFVRYKLWWSTYNSPTNVYYYYSCIELLTDIVCHSSCSYPWWCRSMIFCYS